MIMISSIELIVILLFCIVQLYHSYTPCGRNARNFRNMFTGDRQSEAVLIETFFDSHICSVDSEISSFTECFERCNSRDQCVGFAQIALLCSFCQSEGQSNQNATIPLDLRRRYILDMDYLPTMARAIGRDCKDLAELGFTKDGIYWVNPDDGEDIQVYCELNPMRHDGSDGAGWTVIHRRVDGTVDFQRNWNDCTTGFGDLSSNTWLGLINIHRMVSQGPTELHVYLEAHDDTSKYAHYEGFSIADESDNFRLDLSGYSGTAGDAFTERANGQQFTTFDRDNDIYSQNCAVRFGGPWWHKDCYYTNLNGPYHSYAAQIPESMTWHTYNGRFEALKTAVMKIRRV